MSLTRVIGKRAPTLLAITAGVGVIVTMGLTIKATIKSKDQVDEIQKDEDIVLSKEEIVKEVWKNYIPAAGTMILTLTCIIGSRMASQKQINALSGGYMLVAKSFQEYRKKLIDLKGQEVDDEVMSAIYQEHADMEDRWLDIAHRGIDYSPDEVERMFYEPLSESFFTSTKERVLAALLEFTERYHMRGAASVNELLDLLGIEEHVNKNIGWSTAISTDWGYESLGYSIIRVDSDKPNAEDIYAIKVDIMPVPDYYVY